MQTWNNSQYTQSNLREDVIKTYLKNLKNYWRRNKAQSIFSNTRVADNSNLLESSCILVCKNIIYVRLACKKINPISCNPVMQEELLVNDGIVRLQFYLMQTANSKSISIYCIEEAFPSYCHLYILLISPKKLRRNTESNCYLERLQN